jgi:hypothetical protein
MKLKLKAPGTKRFSLKHDELLLTFAFKFNLRRCIKGLANKFKGIAKRGSGGDCTLSRSQCNGPPSDKRFDVVPKAFARKGRAVQVDPIKPMLKAPGVKHSKLICDEPLSTFAFKFNWRRYTKACSGGGRCRWRG